MISRTAHRRALGFSLIELLVVIAIIALLIGILVPVLGSVRSQARRTTDATQVRGIIQAMQIWAGQNDDRYPLPSRLDISHTTVPDPGQGLDYVKDNSGNIMSVMIYNGLLKAEQFISPSEINGQVREDKGRDGIGGYETSLPSLAEDPQYALWDPGFSGMVGETSAMNGVPTMGRRSESQSNNSYAHLAPFGERLEHWSSTANADRGMVANRSTVWTTDADSAGNRIWRPEEPSDRGANGNDSLTLEFYSPNNLWNGHIGYNDTSVIFADRPDPDGTSILIDDGGNTLGVNDNVFVNEALDGTASGGTAGLDHNERRPGRGSNIYLRAYRDVTEDAGNPIRANAIIEPWDIANVTAALGD